MTLPRVDFNDFDWLLLRQEEYEKRMGDISSLSPTSESMFDLHKRVIAEIDLLPKDKGGKT